MSKSPSDVDDIFGAAEQPDVDKPVFAAPSKEARKEVRAKVKWAARVQLPNGNVVEMRVCDISEGGIGLAGEVGIPPNSVLTCAVAVPGLNDPAHVTAIVGTIKTTHCTVRGLDLIYGGTWVRNDASAQDLLKKWIRRLRS
ncbi:MAG: PilZ domain-containing protein [Pseudomonadota bacterium]|nr:PilZ domain-containing protein [Pseudomonadota bacterium]